MVDQDANTLSETLASDPSPKRGKNAPLFQSSMEEEGDKPFELDFQWRINNQDTNNLLSMVSAL